MAGLLGFAVVFGCRLRFLRAGLGLAFVRLRVLNSGFALARRRFRRRLGCGFRSGWRLGLGGWRLGFGGWCVGFGGWR
ncbi:MAG: hypothetical protein J4O00_10715, partial [Chloroflexi bacterium]|nr:hypothetical protein [Chloroflexota bacterium]